MSNRNQGARKQILVAGVAAAALVVAPLTYDSGSSDFSPVEIASAHAASQGQGATQNQGGSGGSGQGEDGQGGPSDDSEGRGPQYGEPDDGDDQGGKPVWAQEGIPVVELGRLNVVRAPDQLFERALDEALASADGITTSWYELSAEKAAALIAENYDTIARIDSPLENLALYEQLIDLRKSPLPNVDMNSWIDLAAIFLGSAADKEIPITADTVIAINTILGVEITQTDNIEKLAEKADLVRESILEGHD